MDVQVLVHARPEAVTGQRGTGEHTRPAAAQRRRVDTGPLQRLPADLQQQPLLGVHGHRLARADPEERRVEPAGVLHEPGLTHVRRAVRILFVQFLDVPSAVGGKSRNGVSARGQQPPEILRALSAAGEAAAHSDDRDRLVASFLDLAQALTRLVQVGRYPLEVIPESLFVGH